MIYNTCRTITPVYIPIAQKDVDRFVFFTEPEVLDEILQAPELPARIKYKLAIAEGTIGSPQLLIKSVCFFCDAGNPTIVQYPVADPAKFQYFPDYVTNLKGKLVRIAAPAVKPRIEVDPPYQGINNAKRGMWKILFEEFLMVHTQMN